MRPVSRAAVVAAIIGAFVVFTSVTSAATKTHKVVSITAAPAFTSADLAAVPSGDWLTDGGSLSNDRYSSLNQINATNASSLTVAWQAHLNGSGVAAKYSAEATPLVYNGVMYVATGNDDAFALDATTGQQLWEYQSHIDQTINTACCGWDNRGLALGGGLVYDAQLDGNLVAIDQMTGGVAWKVPVFNWKEGVTLTSAPLYYNGLVYVGSTGGEFGFRGSVTAYNATNGDQVWRFFTVPEPGNIGGQTWAPGLNGWATGGGTVWNTPSVDPTTNTLVFTTGNAAPWFGRGPGQNLFTSSFVALNATTGQVNWWYQVVHHDIWDYDCPSPTVMFNITIAGTPREGIAEPCKTGWVYELDRTTGQPLVGINETKVPQLKDANTWPTQPIPVGQPFSQQCATKANFTGKSATLAGKPVTAGCLFQPYDTTHAAAFAPTAQGGADWNPSSFNPNTGDLYVCDADSDQSELGIPGTTTASAYLAGKGDTGIDFGKFEFYDGHITAMNMTNNTIAWADKWKAPCYSGTFTTAGNLVFAGQPDGEFDAYNAQTGAQVWSTMLAAGVAAPGMTYAVNGKQYVAIYAGGSAFSFEGTSVSDPKGTFPHGDDIYVFALPS
jgi:PQQ-dependent dehydrogenase (methanol/ethanol family)